VPRSVGGRAEALLAARGDARKLERISEQSPLPTLMFDAERRHVEANRAARLWFRRSLDEIRTYALGDLSPSDHGTWERVWARLLETGVVSGRYPGSRPDGSQIAVVYCGIADVLPGRHIILFAPADWADDELGAIEDAASTRPALLTPRELEVLELAAEGTAIPDLSEELALSPETVRTHFKNIYAKLGVHSRTGAVTTAMRLGLIDR
jgi:DNA-binding CsgD family transcriptional regulator